MNTKKLLWALAVLPLFFAVAQDAQAAFLINIGTDCATVGVWDASTKTCTLSGDLAGPAYITINSHDITLDGAGHALVGGIVVNRFNHTTIKNLAISGPGTSIDLEYAASTTLDNITTSDNTYGFIVAYSPDTTIVNSNVANPAGYGLYAYGTIPNLTLKNNHFSEAPSLNWSDGYHNNIFLYFPLNQDTDQPQHISIDQSNTVDGKTVYYFENQSNRVFDNLPNAGIFYCVQCDGITLSNTTFEDFRNKVNVNLYKTTNSIIKGNSIKYARGDGMYLYKSSGNSIESNTFDANAGGVETFLSTHNTYDKNIFKYGEFGAIGLNRGSVDTVITHNDFTGNYYSVILYDGATADITQNNFYFTSGGKEIWIYNQTATTTISRALPVGGNYYQSYDAVAEGCADADLNGLCDSAYKVPAQYSEAKTTDFYPWAKPNGWETYHPPVAGFSNVLFLPGLEASRLYTQRSSCALGIDCEDQLWEPNTNSDAVDLYLNTGGTSKNLGIYTRDIIKETNTPLYLGAVGENIYKSFSGVMDALVADHKIAEWWPYAYDWRQSVDDIVSNGAPYQNGQVSLVGALQALIHSSKNGKVTVIAHSNGGLLAKALLKKLEDDKAAGRNSLIDHIDTVILVASPQWGTPTAIPALLHGYDQDINPFFIYPFMNASTARELGRNMPAAYGLLPSREYFNHISTPAVLFTPNFLDPYISNEISKYGEAITSYDAEKNFLLGTDGRSDPGVFDTLKPILGNNNLLARAESLHTSIDTMTLPTSIRLVQIAGWGLDTVSGFTYSASTICSYPTDIGCTGSYILDERPIFTADGDKTVVTPSALAMDGEKYWVDVKRYNDSSVDFPKKSH